MIPLNYFIALVGLLCASITDIKAREVPDWLNYTLIAVGFGSSIIASITIFSFNPFFESLIGFAIGFIIGSIFYYSGQWGGGDAKMLMGLGALIGFELNSFPLFAVLLLNIFLIGSVYGVFWSIILMFKHWTQFKKAFLDMIKQPNIIFFRKIVLGILVIAFILFFLTSSFVKILIISFALCVFFLFWFWIYSKAIEKSSMEKTILVNKLTEGEWVLTKSFIPKRIPTSAYTFLLREFKNKQRHDLLVMFMSLFLQFRIFKKTFGKKIVQREKYLYKQIEHKWSSEYNNILDSLVVLHIASTNNLLKRILFKLGFFVGNRPSKDIKEKIHEVLISPKLINKRSDLISNIYKYLEEKGFYYDKDLICDPNSKEGITKDEINTLKANKITSVKIREGIPFIPSFLIAYILFLWLKNWIVYLI